MTPTVAVLGVQSTPCLHTHPPFPSHSTPATSGTSRASTWVCPHPALPAQVLLVALPGDSSGGSAFSIAFWWSVERCLLWGRGRSSHKMSHFTSWLGDFELQKEWGILQWGTPFLASQRSQPGSEVTAGLRSHSGVLQMGISSGRILSSQSLKAGLSPGQELNLGRRQCSQCSGCLRCQSNTCAPVMAALRLPEDPICDWTGQWRCLRESVSAQGPGG